MRTRAGTTRARRALQMGLSFTGLAVLLAACGSTSSTTSTTAKAPVKVGVAVGLTGYLAPDDVPFSEGVRLAAAAINAKGGIDGHKIELTVENMDSSASTGVTVIQQMIDQDGVGVIIGGSTSAATAAYAPIVARAKVPVIAASVLPQDDQWEFSTLQPVTETDQVDLGFVARKLHDSKIAVIYSETPYGQFASAEMKAEAAKVGISVVSSQGVLTDATDLTPQLQAAAAAGAQAIVDVLTGPVHIVEAKSAADLGLKIPIIMGQDTRSIFRQSTAAYANVYWTALGAQVYPHNTDPSIKSANAVFAPIYAKAYGSAPGEANAARGWDTVQILAQAVRASGAVTGTKLLDALEHVDYTGTESQYAYTPTDHTGQQTVANPLGIGHYVGGKASIVYTAS
jgi:branched-chain amino acid transport system substrate-binding protein